MTKQKRSPLSALIILIAITFSAQAKETDELRDMISGLDSEDQAELIMGAGSSIDLFNYETGEMDAIHRLDKLEEDRAKQYLPPFQESHGMYELYIQEGLEPFLALFYTNLDIFEAIEEQGDEFLLHPLE